METKGIVKERFEYIIGFLALVLSLNNFKEELGKINVDLGFISFSLAQYFLTIIIATIVSLHFYFLPHFIQGDSEFAKKSKKILNFIAYAFIFIILINPMVILLTLGIISVGEFVSKNRSFINSLADTTTAIALLTSLLSGFLNAWIRDKKVKRKEDEFEAALRKIESDSELLKENKLPDEQRKRYAEFVKNYFRDMLKV